MRGQGKRAPRGKKSQSWKERDIPEKLKLSIEPISGTHNYFIMKVNNKIVLSGQAKKMEYEGNMPQKLTTIYASSSGVGDGPEYRVTIHLPGSTNDLVNTYSLKGGFHEITHPF
jgi:hypothetical protein